jgi:two-component system chemotaxis response regulator CheY
MLGIDGHQVEMANSGPQALTLFQQRKFDLIITDYEMPEMKGDKLTEKIKTLDAHQPVLMLTAHVEALLSAGNPLSGVDLVIGKPFQLAELRRAVATLLPKS